MWFKDVFERNYFIVRHELSFFTDSLIRIKKGLKWNHWTDSKQNYKNCCCCWNRNWAFLQFPSTQALTEELWNDDEEEEVTGKNSFRPRKTFEAGFCSNVYMLAMKNSSSKHLNTVVNFINILWAAFAPIFLRKKITKPNCN